MTLFCVLIDNKDLGRILTYSSTMYSLPLIALTRKELRLATKGHKFESMTNKSNASYVYFRSSADLALLSEKFFIEKGSITSYT